MNYAKRNVESSFKSKTSRVNHDHIGKAIEWANERLADDTGLQWELSRDRCYQMSNRFASGCKLTELGYPVILVYLGFLNAREMGKEDKLFLSHDAWEACVMDHSKCLFLKNVWARKWLVHNQAFIPLIRSAQIPHDQPIEQFVVGGA